MTILLILHAFITLSLIGVILLQRSEGGGLGLGGSSSSGSMFTARGAANLLTRTTGILAALFIGNCLLMGIISKHQVRQTTSILGASDTSSAISNDNKVQEGKK
jgi:preprotein translocase subunit SecG